MSQQSFISSRNKRALVSALVATTLALLLPGVGAAPQAGVEKVDFNFQIRPLLSDRCFPCHGPDEKARMAGLRLDLPEAAGKRAKSGLPVLAAGDPSRSEVIRRLTSTDPAVQMPPPWSNRTINADEVNLVRGWIEQGAQFKPHWAFIPVGPVEAPGVEESAWPRNPIDPFVLSRLEREGLHPAPDASRETLLRRVTLDLTGLPPTIPEIDAFLADRSTDAYERVVDRLLASPRYGERMASDWLDLARYADTYGYQADMDYDMSPWRDWVIRAFNTNLRFDSFIVRQLAGDLLPDRTRDDELATAFNRLHRQTNEGGSIEEEFRTEYVADRVNTMGTALLGLTVECARCHDHKYDPITQRDYYRLFAFFNNIDESGLYSHFTRATPSPTLLLYNEGVEAKHRALREQIATSESELSSIATAARVRFDAWLRTGKPGRAVASPVASFDFDQIDGKKTPSTLSAGTAAELVDDPKLAEGRTGRAIEFSGDNAVVCRGAGVFTRAQPFSFALWLRPVVTQPRAVVFHRSRAWTDSGSRGYELLLEDGRPVFSLIHFWPGNALSVRAREVLPVGAWAHLVVTYDGSSRASGLRLYRDGRLLELEIVRDHLFKDIIHRKEWGDADADKIDLTLGARFRDAGFKDGRIDEFRVFDRCLTDIEAAALSVGATEVSASAGDDLFAFYLNRHDSDWQNALGHLSELRTAENKLANDVREIMVMRELQERRPSYMLKRGAYDAPGERVEPGTPERIFPMPAEMPRNRLGLARWIVDPRNPLTARTAVNRIWRLHFGRGIVATVENLGSQGQLPTHPELLDWLAARFVESGWDRKALHRLIVTSSSYRQSSQASADLAARDPENLLLARGPKQRLSAEQIRDSALSASGLLSPRIGGPSVKPYQPAGLWEESGTGKTYLQDRGESLYRRSLYTFWRRTSPPPAMTSFDATSREVCTARRETTTTPLQALVLLDDPQFVEAARVLGEGVLRARGADIAGRIEETFRLLTGRRPEARERSVLERLFREQLAYFSTNPGAADRLRAVGEQPPDTTLSPAEAAASAVLASAIMNHDAFVTKR